MIEVNKYFDGKVISLGGKLDGRDFTVGVMESGEYKFTTEKEEDLEVTLGGMIVIVDGSSTILAERESIIIPAGKEIVIKVIRIVAYICFYRDSGE